MQSRSDEFRRHAEECRKLAQRVCGVAREQYEELARQWLDLAERVEGAREAERQRREQAECAAYAD
jgi:predicted YcjX-like family ATPase